MREPLTARFSGAVPVDDTTFSQVVGRHLKIDTVSRENLDPVPTQTAGDMSEDGHAVFELDGERRTRKNLADRSEYFDRLFFGGLGGLGRFEGPAFGVDSVTLGDNDVTFKRKGVRRTCSACPRGLRVLYR